jgi:hypothetical protein
MDTLINGLVEALRRTMAGAVVQDVLGHLGDLASQVEVVGVEAAGQGAGIAMVERWSPMLVGRSPDAIRGFASGAERVLEREGGVVIVTDLAWPDDFIGIASPHAVERLAFASVAVTGDRLLGLLADPYDASFDDSLKTIDDSASDVDVDPLGEVIRRTVSDVRIADVIANLPLPLTRALAAVADGAPATILQLLGPGSSLLMTEYRIVDVGVSPPTLTVFGTTLAQTAKQVIGEIESAAERKALTLQTLADIRAQELA